MPVALTPTDHASPVEWIWVVAFVALLAAGVAWLFVTGSPQTAPTGGRLRRGFARTGDSLQRLTGLPAWCAGGVLVSLWALTVALVGFFWDVAWHIDLGRDTALFTVPHVLIIVGLFGIGLGALVSIAYATLHRADTPWRLGGLRIPRGA